MTRRIVDARADGKGNISHVRLDGNQRFTPVTQAIPMARRGEIENAHVVDRRGAVKHLRTNPDGASCNNLDTMAGDV
jgi:Protein of unknown function (DUF3892)